MQEFSWTDRHGTVGVIEWDITRADPDDRDVIIGSVTVGSLVVEFTQAQAEEFGRLLSASMEENLERTA